MSVTDDPTEAICFVCEERVELYAPGESYTVRERRPVHLKCAAQIDESEREASALPDFDPDDPEVGTSAPRRRRDLRNAAERYWAGSDE